MFKNTMNIRNYKWVRVVLLLLLFAFSGCGFGQEKADEPTTSLTTDKPTAGQQSDETTGQNTDDTPASSDTDDISLTAAFI